MKEKVLITGASGFVGYHLIEEALKNNLEVYAAVRKSSKVDHLKDYKINYIYPDFDNIDSLKQELEQHQFQYIIHAAGATKARSAEEYNQINAEYTFNLAQAAAYTCKDLKKFVLISSLAAVGPLSSQGGIITEETTPKPVTSYGRSKLLAEERIKEVTNLNYTILRPTAVYGPRDKDIFIFFKQVSRGIEPYIGSMAQTLSFIYVKDLAMATVKALHAGDKNTYNLSDGLAYNRYELARFIKDFLNLRPLKFHLPVIFVKLIAYLSEKYGSLSNKAVVLNAEKLNELMAVNWACGIDKAKTDLGFNPLYNLEAGVAESIEWYKSNKWL